MISKRVNCWLVFSIAVFFISIAGTAYADYWTKYISEENPPVSCGGKDLVAGMRCTGGRCDNISILCRGVANDISQTTQWWGPYCSEEEVNNMLPNGYYAKGISCQGKNCDNQSLLSASLYRVYPGRTIGVNHNSCQWTHWFSEENNPNKGKYNSAICPKNKYMVGMTCRGGDCDLKQLLCCGMQ